MILECNSEGCRYVWRFVLDDLSSQQLEPTAIVAMLTTTGGPRDLNSTPGGLVPSSRTGGDVEITSVSVVGHIALLLAHGGECSITLDSVALTLKLGRPYSEIDSPVL